MSAPARTAALALAAALTAAPALAQNLVNNGSFEATTVFAGSGWSGAGFSAEGFDFMIDTDPARAHGGNHSFSGGAIGAPGFIAQNLSTTPGTLYDISLWLANFSGSAQNTMLQVKWDGQVIFEATGILGFGYQQIRLRQLATGASSAFAIGLRDDSFFLSLDDVVVSAVPEPSVLALFALGLAGVAGLRARSAAARQ